MDLPAHYVLPRVAVRLSLQAQHIAELAHMTPTPCNVQYWREDQSPARPVIVHRAILGSVERMFAILTEHYAQRWPLWLSPRQIMVVPITTGAAEYAVAVRRAARAARFHADVDARDQTMQKKVCPPLCVFLQPHAPLLLDCMQFAAHIAW